MSEAFKTIIRNFQNQMNTFKTISRAEAVAQGMKPLTIPSNPEEPFLQNVIKDMQRVKGTIWALVQYKVGGALEVWRVPLAPLHTDKGERLST